MGECPDPWGRVFKPSSTSLPMSQKSSIHLGGHRCHLPVQFRKRPLTPPPTPRVVGCCLAAFLACCIAKARHQHQRPAGKRRETYFQPFLPSPSFHSSSFQAERTDGMFEGIDFPLSSIFPPPETPVTGGKDSTVLLVPLPFPFRNPN